MVDGTVRLTRGRGHRECEVVVGRRFVATVVAPAPNEAIEALVAAAADATADLEHLIAAMPPPGGPGDSFALAWWPDPAEEGADAPTTVVVRGASVVDVATGRRGTGSRRRLSSEEIRPWHLAEFDDVESLRFHASAEDADADPAPGSGSNERADALAVAVRATEVEWRSPEWSARHRVDVDTRFGDRPAGGSPTDDEGEDQTAPEPASIMRFRIDDGPARDILTRVVLGRRPLGIRAGDADQELVALPGADPGVSASHLELRREGARLVATDLRSTNGTVIERDGLRRRMRAGESVVVNPGTRLRLGADTIIEILPPRIAPSDELDRQAPS